MWQYPPSIRSFKISLWFLLHGERRTDLAWFSICWALLVKTSQAHKNTQSLHFGPSINLYYLFIYYWFLEREGREKHRCKRNIHWMLPICTPTGDWTKTFHPAANEMALQPTEPHLPGLSLYLLEIVIDESIQNFHWSK